MARSGVGNAKHAQFKACGQRIDIWRRKSQIIVAELLSQTEIQESPQLAASFVVNHGHEP
jgi:hypothetical protein